MGTVVLALCCIRVEPSNSPMQLTATIAACGVLRPPRLLRMAAADWNVRRIRDRRANLCLSRPLGC